MRLAVEMAVIKVGDKWTAVSVGEGSEKFHGMLRLNETGAEIVRMLSEDTTPRKMHKALCEKYTDVTRDELAKALADFLAKLYAEGLLTE